MPVKGVRAMTIQTQFYQRKHIAALLGVSKDAVIKWEKTEPNFPPRHKINRTVLYRISDFELWLESRLDNASKEKSL